MTSKHKENSLRVCHDCDKEFFRSETLTVHIENDHGATLRNNQHEYHTRRYHFEKTPCGNCMCYDTEGLGLGCVCHSCDADEDANIAEEDRQAELEILAGFNDEEDLDHEPNKDLK